MQDGRMGFEEKYIVELRTTGLFEARSFCLILERDLRRCLLSVYLEKSTFKRTHNRRKRLHLHQRAQSEWSSSKSRNNARLVLW